MNLNIFLGVLTIIFLLFSFRTEKRKRIFCTTAVIGCSIFRLFLTHDFLGCFLLFVIIGLNGFILFQTITKEKRLIKRVYKQWKGVPSTSNFKLCMMLNLVSGNVWNRFSDPNDQGEPEKDIIEIPVDSILTQVMGESGGNLKEKEVVNAICTWIDVARKRGM